MSRITVVVLLLLLLLLTESSVGIKGAVEKKILGIVREGLVPCLGVCRCDNSTNLVDCSNLRLKAVPENIPTSTVALDLSENFITQINGGDFDNLSNLCNLDLRSNVIEAVQESSLTGLTSLVRLDISYNRLTTWSGNITAPVGRTLVGLDLSGNQLQEVDSSMFDHLMVGLKELRLDENGLRTMENNSLENLPNLKVLSLRLNVLKELNLWGVTKLEELYLDQNFFSYFPDVASFGDTQKSLSLLSFSGHQRVSSLPPLSFPLLRHFNVSFCNLNRIENFTFEGTPRLIDLDISNNVINSLSVQAMHGLTSLKNLDLSRNSLIYFPYRALSPVGATLERLEADHLQLTRIRESGGESNSSSFFRNLKFLSLQNNFISAIEYKSFFQNLQSLEVLRLSSTRLTQFPTEAIAHLTGLQELEFKENLITNLTASSFPELTSLHTLSLDGSALLEHLVNGTFSNLYNLATISITGGAMTSIDIGAFSGLVRLSQVLLNNNNLRTPNPEWFEGNHMGTLMMGSNPWTCDCEMKSFHRWLASEDYVSIPNKDLVTCYYPRDVRGTPVTDVTESSMTCDTPECPLVCVCLHQAEGMFRADCSGEGLEVVPPQLPSSVQALNMNSNFLQVLNNDTIGKLPAIREVQFASNNIEIVEGFAFSTLSKIYSIDLSSNLIRELPATAFAVLPSLQQLRLDGNLVSNISTPLFSDLCSLLSLDLSRNNIASLGEETFAGLGALQTLLLAENLIEHLGLGIFRHLVNIKFLYLPYNRLHSLHGGAFSATGALQMLDLSGNRFDQLNTSFISSSSLTYLKLDSAGVSDISSRAFGDLPKLSTLRMSGNNIENIANDAFSINVRGESQLISVDFNSNRLRRVPIEALESLDNLQSLYLSDNLIHNLSFPSLSVSRFLPNLNTFHLAKNDITDVTNTSILRYLTNLNTLILNEAKLSRIPPDIFPLLPNLRFLSLDDNRIENVSQNDIPTPHNLTGLSLRFNPLLAEISREAFSSLPYLSELRLEAGTLRHIDRDAFLNLKRLSLLDISNNQLTTPHSGWFASFESDHLVSVAMDGNPWSCNCEALPYKEWVLGGADGLTPYSLSVTCDEPFYLIGAAIEDAAISCEKTTSPSSTTMVGRTTSGSKSTHSPQYRLVAVVLCYVYVLHKLCSL